jgi:hypothetical protein
VNDTFNKITLSDVSPIGPFTYVVWYETVPRGGSDARKKLRTRRKKKSRPRVLAVIALERESAEK